MRVSVYTEEMLWGSEGEPVAELVYTDYISSRTKAPTRNYGVRIFMKSAPGLHHIPGKDDDRSAVTFWCGEYPDNCTDFLLRVISIIQHQGSASR